MNARTKHVKISLCITVATDPRDEEGFTIEAVELLPATDEARVDVGGEPPSSVCDHPVFDRSQAHYQIAPPLRDLRVPSRAEVEEFTKTFNPVGRGHDGAHRVITADELLSDLEMAFEYRRPWRNASSSVLRHFGIEGFTRYPKATKRVKAEILRLNLLGLSSEEIASLVRYRSGSRGVSSILRKLQEPENAHSMERQFFENYGVTLEQFTSQFTSDG